MEYRIFARPENASSKGVPLYFFIGPKKQKMFTGIHCKEGSWNQEGQTIQTVGKNKDPKAFQKNSKLRKHCAELDHILETHTNIKEIRRLFKEFLKGDKAPVLNHNSEVTRSWTPKIWDAYHKSPNKEFFMLIEEIIYLHRNDWSEGHLKKFRSLRTKFLEFDPNFTVHDISEDWWLRYVNWCFEKQDNVNNTINRDSKVVRQLVKELRWRGVDFPPGLEERLQWGYIEPDVKGPSWDKVLAIRDVDLSGFPSSTIEDSRTLWVVGALTGRRWEEIKSMTEHNFYKEKGVWKYRNMQKGTRLIDVPLIPEAVEYLKKIKFKLPNLTEQTVNEDIKMVAQKAGLNDKVLVMRVKGKEVEKIIVPEYKTITIHSGRHAFGQHLVEISAGQPHYEKWVSFMLGHASFQTTWKYINRVASSNEGMYDKVFKKGA